MFFTALKDGMDWGWRIGLASCFRSLRSDRVLDGEDMLASLLSTLKVRTATQWFDGIRINRVLGTANRLRRNQPAFTLSSEF
jgi:hypothetical protein